MGSVASVVAPILALASPATALAGYALLSSYALKGNVPALKALSLAWFIGSLNPGISAGGEVGGIGKLIVFLAAACSVFAREMAIRNGRMPKNVVFTIALGIIIILHSALFSQIPDVSAIKAATWTIVFPTIILAFSSLSRAETESLETWLFRGCLVIMWVSWPFVLTPVGYLTNDRGFQGILNHPQTMGVFAGLLCGWITAKILGSQNPSLKLLLILGSGLLLLLLSQARTGAIVYIGGVAAAITILSVSPRHRPLLPGIRKRRVGYMVLIASLSLLFSASLWLPSVGDFIFKNAQYGDLRFAELYQSSRGGLTRSALENFFQHPYTGIGFGIDVNREMIVTRDPVLGLPLSAPVEKGNAYFASLEELGILVSGVVLAWLVFMFRSSLKGGLVPSTMFSCALIVNVSEAVIFSPGGLGLLVLLFLGFSVSQISQRRLSHEDI